MLMLQYSTYSVISPEGCASILWKSAEKAEEAAEAMGVTAERLTELELIDGVLEEPLGGAHRDPEGMAETISGALAEHLSQLGELSVEERVSRRYQRLMAFGRYEEG